jgi:hypothetical protein
MAGTPEELAWLLVRVLLISAYELGHQPLHVASPAAALRRARHELRCLDLSVQPWDRGALQWAQAVGGRSDSSGTWRPATGVPVRGLPPERPRPGARAGDARSPPAVLCSAAMRAKVRSSQRSKPSPASRSRTGSCTWTRRRVDSSRDLLSAAGRALVHWAEVRLAARRRCPHRRPGAAVLHPRGSVVAQRREARVGAAAFQRRGRTRSESASARLPGSQRGSHGCRRCCARTEAAGDASHARARSCGSGLDRTTRPRRGSTAGSDERRRRLASPESRCMTHTGSRTAEAAPSRPPASRRRSGSEPEGPR